MKVKNLIKLIPSWEKLVLTDDYGVEICYQDKSFLRFHDELLDCKVANVYSDPNLVCTTHISILGEFPILV